MYVYVCWSGEAVPTRALDFLREGGGGSGYCVLSVICACPHGLDGKRTGNAEIEFPRNCLYCILRESDSHRGVWNLTVAVRCGDAGLRQKILFPRDPQFRRISKYVS